MKKSDTHAFVNQLLVCTLVMICVGGSVGLGGVWMRHRISVSANNVRQLEASLTEVERRMAEVSVLVAGEQSPEALDQKNVAMNIGLVPKRESQLVWISQSPEERLAARRNLEIFAEESVRLTPVQYSSVNTSTR